MSIIAWIIFGLIAGALAKLLLPGDDPGGFILTIVLGIVGALIGGFIVGLLSGSDFTTHFNFASLIVAILGAIVVLLIYRVVVNRAT
jgi:uncharacterized membrane protein YeaQ/YmgE (transglycosylase-associated protein family)